MDWDAIGAIGQAVSALALVFVLIQVRHAREDMQRTVVRMRVEGTRDMYLARATNADLASTMMKAWNAAGRLPTPFGEYLRILGLSDGEADRVFAYSMAVWQNIEASIESFDRLSPGVKFELDRAVWGNYNSTNVVSAKFYELSKSRLNPDAVRYVDNVLAQPG